jgi:hypothetical protein
MTNRYCKRERTGERERQPFPNVPMDSHRATHAGNARLVPEPGFEMGPRPLRPKPKVRFAIQHRKSLRPLQRRSISIPWPSRFTRLMHENKQNWLRCSDNDEQRHNAEHHWRRRLALGAPQQATMRHQTMLTLRGDSSGKHCTSLMTVCETHGKRSS